MGRKINVLLNINDYYGEHRGKLAPWLIFILLLVAPMLVWIFMLMGAVPFPIFMVFYVLYAIRAALITIGHEKEKLELFEQGLKNEYASAYALMKITNIDGECVEYADGHIAYFISAMPNSYVSDDLMTDDFEQFYRSFGNYPVDIYGYNVVDELKLSDRLNLFSKYSDVDFMKDRLNLYRLQDAYCHDTTTLFRYVFVIYAPKYDYERLSQTVHSAVNSSTAKCFKYISLCKGKELIDVLSRDLCTYIDVEDMLVKRFNNTDYGQSKVLFYDNNVPAKYLDKEEAVALEKRRATE